MGEFRMPSLGADMDVGTIIEWLVKPGDVVKRGQIVAVVDTAKAAIEIEAFEEGVVAEILVGTGVQVAVGTPLAMIGPHAAAVSSIPSTERTESMTQAAGGPPTRHPRRRTAPSHPRATPPEHLRAAPPEHPRATPPVRHLAHQLGVELDSIAGSGPDGHITHDDVLRAAPQTAVPRPSRAPQSRPPLPDRSGFPTVQAPRSRMDPGSAARKRTDRWGSGGGGERLRVTPRARRIAAERGIDLAHAIGTGGAGVVLGADVERAAEALAAEPTTGPPEPESGPAATTQTTVPTTLASSASRHPAGPAEARTPAGTAAQADKKAAMRTAIANLMSRSNAEIPHYYVSQTIDLGTAMPWLRTHNATLPVAKRVLPAALFLRATVLAAAAVPDLNGHWVDGALRPAERIDLGVAVATRGGGLVTPAIPDAGPLRIDDLMAALSDLVVRARRGALRQAEMAGASITVSSLGETGPDALYGVIFPPQVALVGIGGIVERPWAVNGMLTVRPTVTVVLAADHRASDGRTASAFLATFAHALQNPEEL